MFEERLWGKIPKWPWKWWISLGRGMWGVVVSPKFQLVPPTYFRPFHCLSVTHICRGYGLVSTCRDITQNKIYVVRFVELDEEDVQDICNQLDILREVEHPNLLRYFGYFINDSTLTVTFYCYCIQ